MNEKILSRVAEVLELQSQLLHELAMLMRKLGEAGVGGTEKYYSIKEVCRILSVSYSTVRRLINAGHLRCVRLQGKLLIPASSLTELETLKNGKSL